MGILCQPRSAAGSIVLYCLNVADVTGGVRSHLQALPNPDRVQMPDVDMDFRTTGATRLSVCNQEVRLDKVAQIATFGRLAARAAMGRGASPAGIPP